MLEDWQSFGPDYDRTLMQRFRNFDESWPALEGRYDGRFYRMWKYYLLSCAGSFRARKNQVWQIVLSPARSPRRLLGSSMTSRNGPAARATSSTGRERRSWARRASELRRRLRYHSSRLVPFALGLLSLWGFSGLPAAACDWPEIDPSGWPLVEGTGFSVRVPPAYRTVLRTGNGSEVQLWRAGERTLRSDWGERSKLGGGRRQRREGDREWSACDAVVGGYEVQVVTYRTPRGYFVAEAFWDALPESSSPAGRIRPVLWLAATGPDRPSQREALAIIRSVTFPG